MTESHEQASINHPIRLLRRHLPYLGKAVHQASCRHFHSCPFRSFRPTKPLVRGAAERSEAGGCTIVQVERVLIEKHDSPRGSLLEYVLRHMWD